MRNLFKDKDIQSKFESNGFVKVSLLDNEEVQELLVGYTSQQFDNKIEEGFHISLDNQNEELVKEVGENIKKILIPKTETFLDDCKVFTASYVIKEPGLKNIVPPHQDWSFVDETQFCSATVWTALVDVTEQNGALGVIKGSHRLFKHERSSPSPQSKSPLADHVFTLFPFTEIIELKAGESLIFDNRLIHASPPNLSDDTRIAVGIGITQKEANLKHYYQLPNTDPPVLKEFDIDESFFPWFNNKRLSDLFDAGNSPEGLTEVRTFEREVPDLSKEEMEALVTELDGVEYNRPFMERLAKLFDYPLDGEKNEAVPQEIIESGEWRDDRSFFRKYSPGNMVREIAWRLKGRPNTN